MPRKFNVVMGMVHRSALQEHPGVWDHHEMPPWSVGDYLIFVCHGEVIEKGQVLHVRPPKAPGQPNFSGTNRDNWWQTTFERGVEAPLPVLEHSGEDSCPQTNSLPPPSPLS